MATPPAAPSSFPSASEPLRGSRTHCPRLCRGLLAGGRPAARLDQQVGQPRACQSGFMDPIASVLLRGLGRRGICIGSTLPVLSNIGGDADIALQQQAGFLFVVGPGERTDLTAPDGPAGQAQAQPRAINSQGSNRPRAGVKRRLWHRCGWWQSHRRLLTSPPALAQVPIDRADAGSALSLGGSRQRRWDPSPSQLRSGRTGPCSCQLGLLQGV